jgi:hypothetical protein
MSDNFGGADQGGNFGGADHDLEYFFAGLRTVAEVAVLADPADIRRTGRHRNNVRRAFVTVSVAVLLAVGGLAAYGSRAHNALPVGPNPTESSVAATPSVEPTTTSPAPSASASSNVAMPRAPGADCRPNDLDARPYYGGEGAAGTAYLTVVVQNVSGTRCRLYGHPTVLFTDPATGQTGTMPTRRESDASPVMLQPGQWAQVTFATTNGNPYGPGAPECSHPGSYKGLSLVIGDDLPYRLPGLTLSWECGDARIGPWSPAPNGPAASGATVRRAPAP